MIINILFNLSNRIIIRQYGVGNILSIKIGRRSRGESGGFRWVLHYFLGHLGGVVLVVAVALPEPHVQIHDVVLVVLVIHRDAVLKSELTAVQPERRTFVLLDALG